MFELERTWDGVSDFKFSENPRNNGGSDFTFEGSNRAGW